ncbi:MAG TPA: phosphoglycerate mutase family protein [Pyrinomonadaceae bacterium]|jgi:broad specificity phosphatase PhoE|nr:phosphoglycerate mutase family protein [Pyrinomonadaceae bacterium]
MQKIIILFLAGALFCVFAAGPVFAQEKTIILVRHAERDTSETANSSDPPLTTEGKERADRLVKAIKKYRPGAVYSTDFMRTRDTAAPISKRRRLQLKIYDGKNQNVLVDEILKSKTKRFVIVGHSNTIPSLANLLLKQDLLKAYDESVYGNLLIVRIEKGEVRKLELVKY